MENIYRGIVIAGPTGVGKTSLSIKLAKALNSEIISADSAQVFKELDIGTAKVTNSEMCGITHHLIDILTPTRKYSVGDFQLDADKIINELESKNIIPIIAGGTGLYIDSITEGLAKLPPANPIIRAQLDLLSTEDIYNKLTTLDPDTAQNIHPNNRVKLERALEVCIASGGQFSVLSKQNIKNNNCHFLKIALERDRAILYDRINMRVDIMIRDGLFDEVESLYKKYGAKLKKLNIIGYSEIISVIENELTLDEAIDKIKQNSRHYAKRQLTWFKNSKDYIWFDLGITTEDEIIRWVLEKLPLIK